MSNWERVNVAGVTHNGRQRMIRRKCRSGDVAELRRESNNAYDANAVAVFVRGKQIGYLPADLAKSIAPDLDSGLMAFTADVYQVGSFETDDGREIWTVTLDIHWKQVKTTKRSATPHSQAVLAEKSEPESPPTQSGHTKDIIRAIMQACRAAGIVSAHALRIGALKLDGILKHLSGDDTTLLWILRFFVASLVFGPFIVWLVISC